MKSKNAVLLDSFTRYCQENPELRFWQALRAWARVGFLIVHNRLDNLPPEAVDTFYWETRNGL